MVEQLVERLAPADTPAARYAAALVLVERIDADLAEHFGYTRPDPRYRNKSGQLLHSLDQVVRAILADDLMGFEEAAAWVWWTGDAKFCVCT